MFHFKYEKNEDVSANITTTYGFNMNSLEKIKSYLKSILPNIILCCSNILKSLYNITNTDPIIDLINLILSIYIKIKIEK